ncbi:hypothetical protein [Leptolyngbya ohadii]|uniref:hypothetical protein n=1 Tax=Leptolyngbya ohadii TaxID=1962290 RepID=UPI000B59C76A|nr:hypothetical protein [Leptolyngbya ohadii]
MKFSFNLSFNSSFNFLFLLLIALATWITGLTAVPDRSIELSPLSAAQAQNLTVDVSLPVEARVITTNGRTHIGQLIEVNAQQRQLTVEAPYDNILVRMDEVERIEFPQNALVYSGPNLPVRGERRNRVGEATWGPIALSGLSVADAEWGLARIAGVRGVSSASSRTYVVERIQFNSRQNNMTVHVVIYQ